MATGSSNSCIQVQYAFGAASHAAGSLEKRRALDAVEPDEHWRSLAGAHERQARVHYAITDAGGRSPNVGSAPWRRFCTWSAPITSPRRWRLLQKRGPDRAGAAMMTDTTFERKFIDGLADTVTNHTLEKLLYENFAKACPPTRRRSVALRTKPLQNLYRGRGLLPGIGSDYDAEYAARVKTLRSENGGVMNDFLLPLYQGGVPARLHRRGDVSWQCPTAQIHVRLAQRLPGPQLAERVLRQDRHRPQGRRPRREACCVRPSTFEQPRDAGAARAELSAGRRRDIPARFRRAPCPPCRTESPPAESPAESARLTVRKPRPPESGGGASAARPRRGGPPVEKKRGRFPPRKRGEMEWSGRTDNAFEV